MKLEKLEKKPFFTTNEAHKAGVSSRMLSYYVERGDLIRLSRGVYCSASFEPDGEDLKWSDLAIASKNIQGGVICLISALNYYDLTDEMMKEFWVAVENRDSRINFPMSRIVRMRNLTTGVKTIKLSGLKVKIFDVERTLVDSFRLLDFETAMKALKLYLNGHCGKPNISKLNKYTTELRASKVKEYISALVA